MCLVELLVISVAGGIVAIVMLALFCCPVSEASVPAYLKVTISKGTVVTLAAIRWGGLVATCVEVKTGVKGKRLLGTAGGEATVGYRSTDESEKDRLAEKMSVVVATAVRVIVVTGAVAGPIGKR